MAAPAKFLFDMDFAAPDKARAPAITPAEIAEKVDNAEAQAYRALLETNLLMYAGNGPIYTLSPATGRVVFANRYRLGGMDAVMLRSILAHLAAKAMDWRKDQLLDPPPVRRHHGHASKIPQLWSRPTPTDDDAYKH